MLYRVLKLSETNIFLSTIVTIICTIGFLLMLSAFWHISSFFELAFVDIIIGLARAFFALILLLIGSVWARGLIFKRKSYKYVPVLPTILDGIYFTLLELVRRAPENDKED